mgnify:FL=1
MINSRLREEVKCTVSVHFLYTLPSGDAFFVFFVGERFDPVFERSEVEVNIDFAYCRRGYTPCTK